MRTGSHDVEGLMCNAAAAPVLVSDNILFFLGLPRGGLARKTYVWAPWQLETTTSESSHFIDIQGT